MTETGGTPIQEVDDSYLRAQREGAAGGKLLTIEQAEMMGFHEIISWLREAKPFTTVEAGVEIFHMAEGHIKLRLYTARYRYTIQVHHGTKTRGDYMGCSASPRMPRVGAAHSGGSDLHDGHYSAGEKRGAESSGGGDQRPSASVKVVYYICQDLKPALSMV